MKTTRDSSSTYHGMIQQARRLAEKLRFEEARHMFIQALGFGPATATVLADLGACCLECGDVDEAIAYHRTAVAIDPEDHRAHAQLGMLLLMKGHYSEGISSYEHRKHVVPRPMPAAPPIPEWNFRELDGRGLLILKEQGLGDVIHFVRYVPQIAPYVGRVYLDVQAPLRPLLRVQSHLGTVLESGDTAEISAHAYCLDLIRLVGDGRSNFANAVPYIHLPPDPSIPEPVPAASDSFKVGIAWAGNKDHGRDRTRSMDLNLLRPLLSIEGCRFFGLMVGERAADIVSASLSHKVLDLSPHIKDFLDLAMVISSLDLVITVDSAVGHLAGALGKRVWTMISTPPDWRWGMHGSTTPWYPTMRLFRQPRPRDWWTVVTRIEIELRNLLSAGIPR